MPVQLVVCFFFFFSSRRRHTRFDCDWSSDVCSSDLFPPGFTSPKIASAMALPPFSPAYHPPIMAGTVVLAPGKANKNGRGAGRGKGEISGGAGSFKKKKKKKNTDAVQKLKDKTYA